MYKCGIFRQAMFDDRRVNPFWFESTGAGGIFGGVPLEFYDMSFICKQAISKPTVSL